MAPRPVHIVMQNIISMHSCIRPFWKYNTMLNCFLIESISKEGNGSCNNFKVFPHPGKAPGRPVLLKIQSPAPSPDLEKGFVPEHQYKGEAEEM